MSSTVYNSNIKTTSSTYVIAAGGGGSSSGTYTGSISIPTANSGMYLTSSGFSGISTTTSIPADLKISGKNPTLSTDKSKIDIDEMADLLKMFKEVMFFAFEESKVLEENPTLNDAYTNYKNKLKEKYSDPELQEAYNQYKLIKALSTEEKDYSK
jgi:hypothetical protein